MSNDENFGGPIPDGVSVEDNIRRALDYQASHSPEETFDWFYDHVKNNKDGHLPLSQSMDYKQINPLYADFGNYNYGAVGRALGIPDIILKYGAGWAQGKADGLDDIRAVMRALLDFKNKGDNSGDQELIRDGVSLARGMGYVYNDFGMVDFFTKSLLDALSDMGLPMPDGLANIFSQFMNWRTHRDPLSLDLDGDGLETMAQAGFSGVLFDHDADGIKTATGWIGRDDGFLARDLNGNGQIDSGAELFGDSTRLRNGQLAKNGFAALADLDENADGRVDINDSAFASLRVWKDTNSNGVVDAGELRTLAETSITALNTAHTTGSTNLADGNQIAERGSYVGANNQLGLLGDLNFSESNFHRTFTDHLAPALRTRNLANAKGAGMVLLSVQASLAMARKQQLQALMA